MNTLIFNGSPRPSGGTARMAAALSEMLPEQTQIVDAYRCGVSPCTDCRFCWTHDRCAIADPMQALYRRISDADCIVIASPIYFAELTGPLLSLASRLQYLWTARRFRQTEVLAPKRRRGAVLLTDGGEGVCEPAMAMAKRLLRVMGADFSGSVYFSGTDQLPAPLERLPEEIVRQLGALAETLRASE